MVVHAVTFELKMGHEFYEFARKPVSLFVKIRSIRVSFIKSLY
jgi:hypothetical protein